MNCTHCGSSAVYAGFCSTCSRPQTSYMLAKSRKRVAEKRRTCKHKRTRKMPDDYTGGLGYKVERCEDCGIELRAEVA